MQLEDTSALDALPVGNKSVSDTPIPGNGCQVSGCGCETLPEEAVRGPLTLSVGQDGPAVVRDCPKPSARLLELGEWFSSRGSSVSSGATENDEGSKPEEFEGVHYSSFNTGAQVVENSSGSSETLSGVVVMELTGSEAESHPVEAAVYNRIEEVRKLRERSLKVAGEFRRRGDVLTASRLSACGSDVWFRRWCDTGEVDLLRADWCQKRILCGNCEKARTARTLATWIPKIREVLRQNPELVPTMVTLTVRDGDALVERVRHAFDSLNRVRQRRKDSERGRGDSSQFDLIAGAVWQLEVKRGSGSGLWHPHFHGLCLRDRHTRFDVDALRREWSEATGGDSFQVDVQLTGFGREMVYSGEDAGAVDERLPELLVKDLCEVLKYCLKVDDSMTAGDVVDVYQALYRKRLVRSWGLLYGLAMAEADNDGMSGYGDYVDYIFRFMSDNEYRLKSVRFGSIGADVISRAESRPRFITARWPCGSCGCSGADVDYVVKDNQRIYLCAECRRARSEE